MFDAKKSAEECVNWIRDFFEENGKGCNAVLGISGGKDSSVAAALCVAALGKDRVIGVLMPNGEQADIDMSQLLCEHLGIKNYTVNTGDLPWKRIDIRRHAYLPQVVHSRFPGFIL